MDQAGDGTVVIFAQWIGRFARRYSELVADRDDAAPDRLERVHGIQQTGVIRGDP